jgi:hypothetical protein
MSNVPVSKNALQQFNSLINEAHQLLDEARSGSRSDLPRKLAEAENRLNRVQAMLCPIIIRA